IAAATGPASRRRGPPVALGHGLGIPHEPLDQSRPTVEQRRLIGMRRHESGHVVDELVERITRPHRRSSSRARSIIGRPLGVCCRHGHPSAPGETRRFAEEETTVKTRRALMSIAALFATIASLVPSVAAQPAAPEGQVRFAVTITLAPTWFDPAETPGVITPFLTLYALHDALVKPMPGNPLAPSLAESWTMSPDGLAYEFVLRKGVKFHDGDPVTAEDVKFSFDRYKGGGATTLKERVAAVEIVDPHRIRFRMKQPWPDFLTFYGTPATGAGWIVPKKYVERVGDDGFKKA